MGMFEVFDGVHVHAATYFTFLSLWSIVLVSGSLLGCNAEEDPRVGTYRLVFHELSREGLGSWTSSDPEGEGTLTISSDGNFSMSLDDGLSASGIWNSTTFTNSDGVTIPYSFDEYENTIEFTLSDDRDNGTTMTYVWQKI